MSGKRSKGRRMEYSPGELTHVPDREMTPALVHALNHPVRRQILRLLAEGKGGATLSPSDMAQAPARAYGPGAYLSVLSFHARVLLKQGVIRSAGTRRVRGATERFYVSNVLDNQVAVLILLNTERDDRRLVWPKDADLLGG